MTPVPRASTRIATKLLQAVVVVGLLGAVAGVLGAAAGGGPAVAAPRSIADCEKIEAADAYNKCLASFGPAAHEHRLSPVAPRGAASSAARVRQRHYGHYSRGASRAEARGRHGARQSMEFTITPRRRH